MNTSRYDRPENLSDKERLHDGRLAALARKRLEEHDFFRFHIDELEFECQNGELAVAGRLPSFYLKQLLQTRLLQVPGVSKVFNHVHVVSASGLSSASRRPAEDGER